MLQAAVTTKIDRLRQGCLISCLWKSREIKPKWNEVIEVIDSVPQDVKINSKREPDSSIQENTRLSEDMGKRMENEMWGKKRGDLVTGRDSYIG